jgi:hypothetical protein
MGWIGVDLDGTLAEYHGWMGELHIGEPIPAMVKRVRHLLKTGHTVKIFTARVCEAKNLDGTLRDIAPVRQAIEQWCYENIGTRLEVTNIKDYGMISLYDDRAYQVVPNTGMVIGEHDDWK